MLLWLHLLLRYPLLSCCPSFTHSSLAAQLANMQLLLLWLLLLLLLLQLLIQFY
jgi:hypothetical protein